MIFAYLFNKRILWLRWGGGVVIGGSGAVFGKKNIIYLCELAYLYKGSSSFY